jgi:hypothetical protein
MPDAETSGGKTPVDIQMRASDAAGAAFETSFVVNTDPITFELINIGRTDIQAGLLPAVFHTDLSVDNLKMRRFIYVESIQKKFVFNSGSH